MQGPQLASFRIEVGGASERMRAQTPTQNTTECIHPATQRVQALSNHVLNQDLYYNYQYSNPKYSMFGWTLRERAQLLKSRHCFQKSCMRHVLATASLKLPASYQHNVTITFLNGGGNNVLLPSQKVPDNQICFLASSEPGKGLNKVHR